MRRGGHQGRVGRIASVGAIEGPNLVSRIRMIQGISALNGVHVPGTAHRSFQEILENKSWGRALVPVDVPVRERRPLPPTREEIEEQLEASGADAEGSFLARLAKKLL